MCRIKVEFLVVFSFLLCYFLICFFELSNMPQTYSCNFKAEELQACMWSPKIKVRGWHLFLNLQRGKFSFLPPPELK